MIIIYVFINQHRNEQQNKHIGIQKNDVQKYPKKQYKQKNMEMLYKLNFVYDRYIIIYNV